MSKYQVGQHMQKRCSDCFHSELKIIKVIQKDFKEKSAYMVWGECPECGANDHVLVPAEHSNPST